MGRGRPLFLAELAPELGERPLDPPEELRLVGLAERPVGGLQDHVVGERLLPLADARAPEEVEELARWPERTAGGLMTTEFISIGPELRISDAIDELRQRAREAETLDIIYVVAADKRL